MNDLIQLLSSLVEGFVGLIGFVVGFITDLIWFVGFIVQMLPIIPSFFTWLPSGLVGMLGFAISVVVILRVLGRGD